MTEKKISSVFISHSSKDDDFVRWLAAELERHGIDVWVDQRHLKPGDSLYAKIGDGLENADRFIIVLTKSALGSSWVEHELDIAVTREMDEKRPDIIIPLLLEKVTVPRFIRRKKFVDFTSGKRRKESLKELLGAFEIEFWESKETGEVETEAELYPNYFLPDLKFFVGRVELLKKIKETLSTDHRAVIHDISGLGNTFTSYKYVKDNLTTYEKIFFIRATREEMLESLARCGEMVNPVLAETNEQHLKALGFKQWLEENENWLVVYDNVDEPAALYPYVPVGKNGDCVFTSNFRDAKNLGTEISILKLEKTDAEILLYSRASGTPYQNPRLNSEEREAFDRIIEQIDGLPLTLNSIGAVIDKKQWTFSYFWGRYEKTPEIAWESEDEYSDYRKEPREIRSDSKREYSAYQRSAGKIFSLIYDELCAAENTGDAVRTILDSVSFISPDEIPEDMLQKILEKQYLSYTEIEDPEGLWDDVREKLTAYDLLKYDRQKKTFTTHRAIQRVIQSRLKGKEKDICVSLADIHSGLFPMYDYTNREECEKYYQHVLVLVENADRFGAETENTNWLYFMLGRYQYRMGNYTRAEKSYLRAAEISAKISGAESESYAIDLNDLGEVYRIQGKYTEALEKLEEVLRIAEKAYGKENANYAAHLTVLGVIYYDQDRYDEAIDKLKEALLIDEKTVGREHPHYATRLNNLANVYYAQGRYDEAIEKYEEALRIDEKTIGCEHPSYALHLSNFAEVRETQGEYQKALEMYEEALRIREKTLPPEHPYIPRARESVERCRNLVN
jgi:hypothetical protein